MIGLLLLSIGVIYVFIWIFGFRSTKDGMERLFFMLAPLPLILGIVIPLFINLLSYQSADNRGSVLFISRAAVLLSALLLVSGCCLTARAIRTNSVNKVFLVVALVVTGLPIGIWGIYFLLSRL